jgi:hypothetical protein
MIYYCWVFIPFSCQVGYHVIDMNQAILHFYKLTFNAYRLFDITNFINKMTLHLFIHIHKIRFQNMNEFI